MKVSAAFLLLIAFSSLPALCVEPQKVHLFVVNPHLVQNRFSTLGEFWASKMNITVYKEVLPGQYGNVRASFVPVIDDGHGLLKTFQKEFAEAESSLKALPLEDDKNYVVWDGKDSHLKPFRMHVTSSKASNSIYAVEEIDAASTNSKILVDALSDGPLDKIKILPIVFGSNLSDGPINYGYTIRPLFPNGDGPQNVVSFSKFVAHLSNEKRKAFVEAFGEMMATLNYKYGFYVALSPTAIQIEKTAAGELGAFILSNTKNIAVDNFVRLISGQSPIITSKRTPQVNGFHFYDAELSQPGPFSASFNKDALVEATGNEKLLTTAYFKTYLKTVEKITGVDAFYPPNPTYSGFLQSLYKRVVAAKSSEIKSDGAEASLKLRGEFQKKFETSQVAFKHYEKDFWGIHHAGLAWQGFKNQLRFRYDDKSRSIYAFDSSGELEAIAYNVAPFKQQSTSSESRGFRDFLSRTELGVSLAMH